MDDFSPPLPSQLEPQGPPSRFKDWASTLAVIVLAPLLALFLTMFVFQTYEVDGPSMETTLSNQDRLIVLKAPKTWAKVTGNNYIPKRYDIIVFNQSGTTSSGEKKQLIKRVIGLPGDRVVIKDGIVKVFSAQHPDGFLVDEGGPEANTISSTPGLSEKLVEQDHIYVLGDNRENSYDSPDFGTVPASDIVGKLSFRIYPFDKFDKF